MNNKQCKKHSAEGKKKKNHNVAADVLPKQYLIIMLTRCPQVNLIKHIIGDGSFDRSK